MTQANLLKRIIISDLNSKGHLAWNNNTVGIYDSRKKLYRKNRDISAIGSADIIACVNGKYVEIEIKIGRDKQSYMQKCHEERVIKAGGKYFIVGSNEDYQKIREQLINERCGLVNAKGET